MVALARDSKEVVAALQKNPLDVPLWREFQSLKASDPFLKMDLTPVLQGAEKIESLNVADKLAKPHHEAFARVAKSPNSAQAIHDVGLIFLDHVPAPEIARPLLILALKFASHNESVKQDILRADAALLQLQKEKAAPQPVDDPKANKPKISTIIRKSGKLSHNIIKAKESLAAAAAAPVSPLPDNFTPQAALLAVPAEELLERTLQASDDGHHEEVESLCAHALQAQDLSPELIWNLWSTLGLAYFHQNKMLKAVSAFRQAHKLKSDHLTSWFNLGVALQQSGHFEEAERCYQEADKIEPRHPKVWCNFGVVYFQTDRYEEAEKAFRTAVEVKPDYARAWDNLGAALGAQDKLTEALEACRQAIDIEPAHPSAWFKRGVIAFHRENYDEAQAAFVKAKAFQPLEAFVMGYLSMIASRKNYVDQAVKWAEQSRSIQLPNLLSWWVWDELNLAYCRQKNFDRGSWAGRIATEEKSDEFDAWLHVGEAYQKGHRLNDAIDAFEQALQIQPKSMLALRLLSQAYADSDQSSLAAKIVGRALEIEPRNDELWDYLGRHQTKMGHHREAERAYKKAKALRHNQGRVETGFFGKLRDMVGQNKK
jgi:tetratricopeptide (TPR) repeat protein